MTKRRALITGITGQDGSYLAEVLLSKEYEVIGITSGKSARTHIAHIEKRIELVTGDTTEEGCVQELVQKYKSDEIYNLASVATVVAPWDDVPALMRSTALTPLYFLESIRTFSPHTRFLQASSAEMYGVPSESPQTEHTPFSPQKPYGIAKEFAHRLVQGYRQTHGLFAVSAILFNHESPRRGAHFITRKVTRTLARIKQGTEDCLSIGTLDAKRDWGYAKEYVEGMHAMLVADTPDDFVLATGEQHSVRELIEVASTALGMPITWEGSGLSEVGKDSNDVVRVRIDPQFYRSNEVSTLVGNAQHARDTLGWKSTTSFKELIGLMVEADYNHLTP